MLVIQNARTGYGPLPILHGISLRSGCDEVVGIVGANGAGKTTLLRAIAGLQPLWNGEISFCDERIDNRPGKARAATGLAFVLDNRALFGELSVAENLALARRTGERSGRSEGVISAKEILDLFPIVNQMSDRPVQLLSGGQQQMVAIARALLLRPKLLVMDEPSAGLAPLIVRHVLDVLKHLKDRGMGVLLIEQNAALVAEIADRGYVLSLGRTVREIGVGQWAATLQDQAFIRAYLGG